MKMSGRKGDVILVYDMNMHGLMIGLGDYLFETQNTMLDLGKERK